MNDKTILSPRAQPLTKIIKFCLADGRFVFLGDFWISASLIGNCRGRLGAYLADPLSDPGGEEPARLSFSPLFHVTSYPVVRVEKIGVFPCGSQTGAVGLLRRRPSLSSRSL